MKVKVLSIIFIVFYSQSALYASQDKASPRELYYRITHALMFILENGESAFKVMSTKSKDNPFIWKDTYIFVADCEKHYALAHPNLKLIGDTRIWSLRDPHGKLIVPSLCKIAKSYKNGGWLEYYWPKIQSPDAETTGSTLGSESVARKISFAMMVPGTPYMVGGGIYSDDITIKWLNTRVRLWVY